MWSNCNQLCIPSDREQYIHHLGRTGREGKEGRGILLLAPLEEYFLDELKDLPVEKFPSLQLDQDTKLKIDNSMTKIDTTPSKNQHFMLGLGIITRSGRLAGIRPHLLSNPTNFVSQLVFKNLLLSLERQP
ncbi:unnamed protein product [Malus baccata var. baccata]